MKVEKKEKYTYIKIEKSTKNDFFLDFTKKISTFVDEHLILDLSNITDFAEKEVLLLKEFALKSRENGTSFVVISDVLDAGILEGELNVVPTLTEAEDFVEMEAIERELGF